MNSVFIININGKQIMFVNNNPMIVLPYIVNTRIILVNTVLLYANKKIILIGTPYILNILVCIINKGSKVINKLSLTFKRRKRYKVKKIKKYFYTFIKLKNFFLIKHG